MYMRTNTFILGGIDLFNRIRRLFHKDTADLGHIKQFYDQLEKHGAKLY